LPFQSELEKFIFHVHTCIISGGAKQRNPICTSIFTIFEFQISQAFQITNLTSIPNSKFQISQASQIPNLTSIPNSKVDSHLKIKISQALKINLTV